MIHTEILAEKQIEILRKIRSLPDGSYMAGGTALALQLGHRTSLDFDFYTNDHFETEIVLKSLQNDLGSIKVDRVAKDTFICTADGVSISLFYYPYEKLSPLIEFENTKLASIEDIAAMKMIAISMRGKRRDFIDAYYLLQKFSLDEIIEFTLKKYPSYQPMVILKGLIYFKDAEDEDLSRGIKIFDKEF
ncbi:MAG: nucleotidyl transferase AbiEii/AbiGii toxin family protein, partial [Candidatus Woesebacteria bacterium]|nr:nucleotidyl transferase AbiEii/AbiGii toxin family protein [Candidatus Woesebacteria bacterium]